MSNNLYNSLNNSNNFSDMIRAFNQFKNTFNGNPKQTVMNMLQSGQISQSQLNQVQNMANQFRNILR